MLVASLQERQRLGQDSVISLTEMERLRVGAPPPEVNNLESFAESKQTFC